MTSRIRPAADDGDLLAGLAVRHEAFRKKLPLAAYQAARLASPSERRATTWVAEDEGRVVATLKCYPLVFAFEGRVFPGYGLGSVATLTPHRRRGLSTALCETVCDAMDRASRGVGLLYAAIAPGFYERLRFATSPAWAWRCDRLDELVASGPAADLVPVDPCAHADRLSEAYERSVAGALHLHRDADGFVTSVGDGHDEWFLALGTAADIADRGYLRLAVNEDLDTLEVLEPVVVRPEDELPALRAAARMAQSLGKSAVTGWFEPTDAVRTWCSETPRATTLPMLRGAPPHRSARFFGSDHF